MSSQNLTVSQSLRRLVKSTLKAFAPPVRPLANDLEWAPSAGFVLHDEKVSTTISFAPLTTTRLPGRYFWEFRLYANNATEPIYLYKSEQMGLYDQETLTSAQIASAAGLGRLFNYCEVMAYSPDNKPVGVSSVLVSYSHFTSIDGSMEAHLPAAYMWGAARYTRTEKYHYENFPAIQLSADFLPVVYLLNPFVRPMRYWIQITDSRGVLHEEGPYRISGKSVALWTGANVPIDSLVGPAGVVVRSESKGSAFVGTIHRPTGRMVNLEHMHPFFSE